jgi:hypothetical protein
MNPSDSQIPLWRARDRAWKLARERNHWKRECLHAKRSDRLEQALRALIDAAHQRFLQAGPVHDYARVELFAALEQARAALKSPISNLQSNP